MQMTRAYQLILFFVAMLFSLTICAGKAQAQITDHLDEFQNSQNFDH